MLSRQYTTGCLSLLKLTWFQNTQRKILDNFNILLEGFEISNRFFMTEPRQF